MDSQKARGIETDGNLIRRAKAYIGYGAVGVKCNHQCGRKINCNGCKSIFGTGRAFFPMGSAQTGNDRKNTGSISRCVVYSNNCLEDRAGALFTAVPGIIAQLVLIPLIITALQKARLMD